MPFGMINCKQYAQLVSCGMDRPLTFRERVSSKIHKWVCPVCIRVENQFSAIRDACRLLPPEDTAPDDPAGVLPEDVRARIKSVLGGHSS